MWETLSQKEVPFVHWLLLHGPRGEIVRVKALFDGRAMVGTMCTSFFKKIQHRLSGQTKPSNQCLCVANGVIVPSQAIWSGVLELGGLQAEGEFEVFDSGRGWEFLFGKPLLHRFKALHDFNTDTVTIRSMHQSVTLHNVIGKSNLVTTTGISLMLDMEQWENSIGGSSDVNPPSRQVSNHEISDFMVQNDKSGCISGGTNNTLKVTDSNIGRENKDIPRDEEHLVKTNKGGANKDTSQKNHNKAGAMEGDQREQREKHGTNQGGGSIPPSREVLNQNPTSEEASKADDLCVAASEHTENAFESPKLDEDTPCAKLNH